MTMIVHIWILLLRPKLTIEYDFLHHSFVLIPLMYEHQTNHVRLKLSFNLKYKKHITEDTFIYIYIHIHIYIYIYIYLITSGSAQS